MFLPDLAGQTSPRKCPGCSSVRPGPSPEPARYGRQRKLDLRYCMHCQSPGLRRLPPRAAQLER